jgi:hypothetical protein
LNGIGEVQAVEERCDEEDVATRDVVELAACLQEELEDAP